MVSGKPILVILNEQAGGNATGRLDGTDQLRALGCSLSVIRPKNPDDALRAIREAGDVAGIAIGGGDGTISLALPALLERRLPLGVLPLGTANDFARSIGVADIESACHAIAQGHVRNVDLGLANGRPFLNVLAVGLPAQAARDLTAERKRRFGIFAALAAAPSIARHHRTFILRVRSDKQRLEARCEAALVGVGRYVGGVPVAYEAIDDGKLHMTACRALTLRDGLFLALSILLRRVPQDAQIIERAVSSLTLETSVPMDVAIDGNICATTPIDARISAAALRVFAPAARSRRERLTLQSTVALFDAMHSPVAAEVEHLSKLVLA